MAPNGATDYASPKLVASLPVRSIAVAHTLLSTSAFLLCLAVGVGLHFERIVKNQYWGYPHEWWPSVSATIGDWYPERNLFQILIAVTSGPRFALVGASYLLSRRPASSVPGFVAICGLLRTLACGGWVFITSSDAADPHDIAMISYIVLNIPWMVGTTVLTTSEQRARTWRRVLGSAFFATLVPLVYWYIQHKVHRRAGAYSIYALFEWSLILLDVAFDSIAVLDFKRLEIRVLDLGEGASASKAHLAPPIAGSEQHKAFASETLLGRILGYTSETRSFLSQTYLALVFWTNLTALPPMIFYSSVWSMGLSGEEVLLFSSLSPALLSSRRIREFVLAQPFLLQLLIFGGNAAYKIDDEGAVRLRVVAFAVGAGCLHHAARWWEARKHPTELSARVGTFSLGLLLSVLLKFANFSLNPFWPIMSDAERPDLRMRTGGLNTIGLVLGGLALLDLALRSEPPLLPPAASTKSADPEKKETPSTATPTFASFLAASTGFGALVFLIHWLFTDSGTIIAWSWEGYPIRGPTAMPHGTLTLLAMSLGVALSHARSLVTSREWLIAGCAGSWVLYATKGWPAFSGGAVLGTFSLSLLPSFVEAITEHSPGSSFFLAFFIYNILNLASVWTVAYAFVPAGDLLRERTDIVLFAAVGLVSLGFANLKRPPSAAISLTPPPGMIRCLRISLVVLLVLSAAVVYHRRRLELPSPYHSEARLVTASIWTVHFALDGRMWESQRRMADIIREAEIDIIGLLESDVQRIVGGNRDITQYISSTLNMYADIGPSPSSNTWGAALLSKFPILNSTHHLLPSPHGELAPAIHATLDVYGTLVDVVVAHNGQEEDPLDRELQSTELARLMREAYPRPVIFLGYVVTKPHAKRPAPYEILVQDGLMLDVDPADEERWCEYILFRGLNRVAYARLNRGSNPSITDTELQVAKFTVPTEPLKLWTNAFDQPFVVDLSQFNRVDESLVPMPHRFDPKFRGYGFRGHYFQVLRTEDGTPGPMYYLSEEEKAAKLDAMAQVSECTQQ
ncbi:Frag1/DRAM/Sfk1 family-domain-containing protein [Leucosporidium creatinivorum]|uniref:Frag1/DRAM/Sfk1 family-domain-containing protein n=1 Tax=Leucosporidium creatinivorum TaxID=106004 RepID=A0A1Y2C8A1_9BASI|nr:Frag1/DRAM/Sfk1 family-domain-containing protein [Leucosporidium creatinivorum]